MAKNKTRTIKQNSENAKKYQRIFQGARESANVIKTVKITKFKGGK